MKVLDVYEFESDYEFETSIVYAGSIVIIEEIHNKDSRDVPPEITFTSLNNNKTYYMFNHDFNDYAVPTGYNLKDEEYQRIFLSEHSDLISKNMNIIKYTFSPEIIKEFDHVFLGAELGLLEKKSNFTMKKFNEFKINEDVQSNDSSDRISKYIDKIEIICDEAKDNLESGEMLPFLEAINDLLDRY